MLAPPPPIATQLRLPHLDEEVVLRKGLSQINPQLVEPGRVRGLANHALTKPVQKRQGRQIGPIQFHTLDGRRLFWLRGSPVVGLQRRRLSLNQGLPGLAQLILQLLKPFTLLLILKTAFHRARGLSLGWQTGKSNCRNRQSPAVMRNIKTCALDKCQIMVRNRLCKVAAQVHQNALVCSRALS